MYNETCDYEVCDSAYGSYRTSTFSDIYPTLDDFIEDYQSSGMPTTVAVNEGPLSATNIYYLLYANYADRHFISPNPTKRTLQLFSIIWQYAPTLNRKLELQDKLRKLTDTDLRSGSLQIHNYADHPDTDPSTRTDEELEYISNQNTVKFKKSKIDAYTQLYEVLSQDLIQEFINKFKVLFIVVAQPTGRLLYRNYIGELQDDN